jgi:hypothetical protein
MARLEWEQAALSAPDFERHPYAIPLNRMAAARWLADAGDAGQAVRLLTWVDGPYLLHSSAIYSGMLTGLVNLERGRIEERSGRAEPAVKHYQDFLRRYDQPSAPHRGLVAEATDAPERLGTQQGRPTSFGGTRGVHRGVRAPAHR